MASEYHKRASSRITPLERAQLVKSLAVISQVHAIMRTKKMSQKRLAEMLDISPAAVSKMLSPGGNLEMNTIVRLELLFGEEILTTPQDAASNAVVEESEWRSPGARIENNDHLKVAYRSADHFYASVSTELQGKVN